MSRRRSDQNTVGVLGAGVMGTGVAQNLAQCGFQVVLIDVDEDTLDKARRKIRNGVRFAAMFGKSEGLETDPDGVLGNIEFTTDFEPLRDAFFVIENVTETWEAKQAVYPQLDAVCPPNTVLAADTSCFPITRIAALTTRPDRVLGIHFMNPVPMKKTVEMIRSNHTSESSIQLAEQLLSAMGKEYVLVNDAPGFVSNRVLMLTINEAVFVLQEETANAKQVDDIFKKCFGHAMGPLETADLIGLDTILNSIRVLHDSFDDDKYRPCPLLEEMVEAGHLGRKSGRGFHAYQAGG